MKTWVVVMALASAAAHAESASRPPATNQGKPAAQAKLLCTTERSTGSHLRRRNCMTQEQRDARRKQDQEAMGRMKGPAQANEIGR